MRRLLAVFVFALGFANFAHAQTYAGDSCFNEHSKQNGVCKLIHECPKAIENIQNQILPQVCSFAVTTPIVCCPLDTPQTTPSTTTSTTTQRTISTNPSKVGYKSAQKCIEYSKTVNVTIQAPTLAGTRRNKTIDTCGFVAVKLIVGGTNSKSKEFPHQAAIGYDSIDGKVYVCGGSLISENFVLTAGHCLKTTNFGDAKYVRVGDLDLKDDFDWADPQELDVIQIIRYPSYRPPSQYHDIGLLKVSANFDFTPYVRPICLHSPRLVDSEQAIATGWGNTNYTGSSSDFLQKVTLELYSNEECKQSYPANSRKLNVSIVDDMQICAGSHVARRDTCQGDSGGPLQIYHDTVYCMYQLIGVTSFGKACAATNSPGVYTRVSHYLEWIETIVWPN